MAEQDIPQSRKIVTRAEAKRRGLKRYFTGKPCGRGHIAERWIGGPCVECHKANVNRWHSENREKVNGGYRQRWKRDPEKYRAKNRKWRKANPDKVREIERRNRLKHPEKRREVVRAYQAKNRDRYDKALKAWRKKHATKVRAYRRKWRTANQDLNRAIARRWTLANPDAVKAIGHARRARLKKAGGRFTKHDIRRIFIEQNRRCAYCNSSIKHGFHIDHFIPVARGGSNWPDNLRLACAPCNFKKSKRSPEEFMASIKCLKTLSPKPVL
jgi:hypothetical protein